MHQYAAEEVPEAAVEEHPEVVVDLLTAEEEEVEGVEEEVVDSALVEAVEGEAVTRILRDQEHSEGAVHSLVGTEFGAACTGNQIFRQLRKLSV